MRFAVVLLVIGVGGGASGLAAQHFHLMASATYVLGFIVGYVAAMVAYL